MLGRFAVSLLLLVGLGLGPAPALGEETPDGFRPITAWRAYRGTTIPEQWTLRDGVISHVPGGGDLVSVESFGNFELQFDWMISAGGNSGVMYRVDEAGGAPYQTGPEYQILDNGGHPDGKAAVTSAASVYGLYAPSGDFTQPVGKWNTGKIIVDGKHVEHWLNGHKVLDYELGSTDWQGRVAAAKFAAWPGYGTRPSGHIDLQDHGAAVSYRNVMIKVLPDG